MATIKSYTDLEQSKKVMKNVIVKTVDVEKAYKCPYCGKESKYGQRMQSHIHICEKLEADKSLGYWRTAWKSPTTVHYDADIYPYKL